MWIGIEKVLAQILFWVYDFIDTIGAIFNILTGTQSVNGNNQTLLEVFVDSAVSTKVLLGLCMVSIVVVGACVGVKVVKNVVKIKGGGEPTSHGETIKQSGIAILSSVACMFFVFLFIAFSSMLLNMVNDVIAPQDSTTLSQNLFELSVEQSYVLDEDSWAVRECGDYYDESGARVQLTDSTSEDGLMWEKDSEGNYVLDDDGNKIAVYQQAVEYYHPYKKDADGNYITESGWVDGYSAASISWSMSPDEVFGVHQKNLFGFEKKDAGYTTEPMVRLESFNLLTAYLVAIIMLISMFMLCVGLTKRIYDIIVLIICMPLVCGTIPLDDGARFRAWRETFMSKILVAFGAVIAINVFYMLSGFITSGGLGDNLIWLIEQGVLTDSAATIFKMLLLLGGAMCINASQILIARILGTSADESREAMQSFTMITSSVRVGTAGALMAGRAAMVAKRGVMGGRNRYGRETVGVLNHVARGANSLGERMGGPNYSSSRGGAFVRRLGRMSNGATALQRLGSADNGKTAGIGQQPSSITPPETTEAPQNTAGSAVSRALGGGGRILETHKSGNGAYTKKK